MLDKKVVLVTGASRGLGAAIAKTMARHGAFVFINYFRSQSKAEQVVEDIKRSGGQAHALRADVTQEEEVRGLIYQIQEQKDRLDVIVNNALPAYRFDPSAPYTSVETVDWTHFDQQISGAIKASFLTVKYALPMMKKQGYGKVINVSSNLVYHPVVTYYDYTTAKAGLVGLTRNLATELGPFGIRVNLLAGGLLQTTDASSSTTPELFETIAQHTPLRRATTTEDFANATLFFASELSDAITGQSISVDGGLTMP